MEFADASAGGSVILPDNRPQISRKFLLRIIREINPTIIKGKSVIVAP
jgi:hypothetical protein